MASPYTSARNGLWDASDVDTWGQGLNVYPQTAADVVNIGRQVTVNVVLTVELGALNITNGGVLKPSTAVNSQLTFGNVDLLINSGGNLGGAVVVPNGLTFALIWNTTGDNIKGITCPNGGIISLYGDPAFYGSVERSTLAANWTSGQTFTVIGDVTAAWKVGQFLTVHKNPAVYGNYNTDLALVSIASLAANGANTNITINEAYPTGTFYSGGAVEMISRNVTLSKLGASTAIGNYNTLRPRIYDRNALGNNNCVISNVLITGFSIIDSSYGFQCLKSPFRNGTGFNYGTGYTVSGPVYSNGTGFNYGTGHTVSGPVYSNVTGFNSGTGHTVSGPVYSNVTGVHSGSGHTVSGPVYSNGTGFNYGTGHTVSGPVYSNVTGFNYGNYFITGKIGFTAANVSAPNTVDILLASGCYPVRLVNAKTPNGWPTGITRNVVGQAGRVACEHYQQVAGAHYIFDAFGDLIKVAADGGGYPARPAQRPGGNVNLVEVIPQSNCSAVSYAQILNVRIWQAGGTTKTYRFYLTMTFAALAKAKLVLYADYLDQVSTGHLATVSSSAAGNFTTQANNSDWSQYVEVTVTPDQDGLINLYLNLMQYESGKKVWVDPEPSGNGGKGYLPYWSYGEVQLSRIPPAPVNTGLIPLGVMEAVQ